MTIIQAIILGLIQGATEFAPVSSSGHLILVPWALGWSILEDPAFNKSFDVALHFGTLFGALVYFRRDVARYITAFFISLRRRRVDTPNARIAWALALGTLPAALVGAAFEGAIEQTLGAPWMIAVSLACFGVILWLVDRYAPVTRAFESIGPRQGLVLGLAQALALQPGVSRSGITITAGRLAGLDREGAARFSFLLALPVIFGAGLAEGIDLVRDGIPPAMGGPLIAGFVAAAISGFLAIWLLLSYLRRHTFTIFMVYRLIVAAVAIAIVLLSLR